MWPSRESFGRSTCILSPRQPVSANGPAGPERISCVLLLSPSAGQCQRACRSGKDFQSVPTGLLDNDRPLAS